MTTPAPFSTTPPIGPTKPHLRLNEVHIWAIPLGLDREVSPELISFLDGSERSRAERFNHEPHRRRFIMRRAACRMILACYLDLRPEQIAYTISNFGKPTITQPAADSQGPPETKHPAIQFSLTHSNELALLAVTKGHGIGVDIEMLNPDRADPLVAKHFFGPDEMKELEGLPEDQRVAGFFNCWTRKEAFIKAIGRGLHVPLDRFSVTLLPGVPAALRRVDKELSGDRRWSIYPLAPDTRYTGAVAVEGSGHTIAAYRFDRRGVHVGHGASSCSSIAGPAAPG